MKKKVLITFAVVFMYMLIFDIVMITSNVAVPLIFLFSAATLCCNFPVLDILSNNSSTTKEEDVLEVISD